MILLTATRAQTRQWLSQIFALLGASHYAAMNLLRDNQMIGEWLPAIIAADQPDRDGSSFA